MAKYILYAVFCVVMLASSNVKAGFEAEHVDISVPTSAWLVGPSMLSAQSEQSFNVPCIMINQFSSGHSVRLSAGGKRIFAMAIDFRQRQFNAGAQYDLDVSVDPVFSKTLTATAHNAETLILNLQNQPDIYEALRSGKILFIKMNDQTLNFALLGIKEGLQRAEACYDKNSTGAVQDSHAVGLGKAGPQDTMVPMPSSVKDNEAAMQAVIDDLIQISADDGDKRQGDHQPVSITGGNLAQNWTSPDVPGTKPEMPADVSSGTSGANLEVGGVRTWRSIRGADLREVLDVWAQKENVRMVWMAGEGFAVQDSISIQGRFEDAVSSVLNQFSEEKTRPVGKIYIDPQFNQKVLLIELKKDF